MAELPTIDSITVADDPERWRAARFEVDGGHCDLGTVRIVLAGRDAGRGMIGWSVRGLDGADLDGLRPSPRHPTHFVIPEAVACAQKIGAKQTWLIHLTHEVDHATVEATLPEGVRLAYDGLRLEL